MREDILMGKLVSIIISVYNKAEFIEKCLDSLVRLDFKKDEMEVIVVDDCSTDDSVELIKKYVERYPFMHLIELDTNSGGPSEPRNIGIKVANGKYIAILDADDWLDDKGFPSLVKSLDENHDDIGFGQIYKHTNNKVQKVALFASYKEDQHLVPYNIDKIFRSVGPPGKVFKKSLVIDHNIKFKHRKYGEDKLFFSELIGKAQTATMTPVGVYHTNRYQENVSLVKQTSVYEKAVINLEILKEVLNLDIPKAALKAICARFIELDFMRRMFHTKTFVKSLSRKDYYQIFDEAVSIIEQKGFSIPQLLTMDVYRMLYDAYVTYAKEIFEQLLETLVHQSSQSLFIENGQVYQALYVNQRHFKNLPIECYPVYLGTRRINGKDYELIHLLRGEKVEIKDVLAVEINNAANAQSLNFQLDNDVIAIKTKDLVSMASYNINLKIKFNGYEETLVNASYPTHQKDMVMKRQNFKVEFLNKKAASSDSNSYFKENPKRVVTIKKIKRHEDKDFKKPISDVEPGTAFYISKIVASSNDTPRLQTVEGDLITANQKFVEQLNKIDEQYYTEAPKTVEIIKTCYLYDSRSFKKEPIDSLKPGDTLTIEQIIYTANQTPRLKTTTGAYLTANKQFVKAIS